MTEQDMTDTPQTEQSAVLEPVQGQTAITPQSPGDVAIQLNESTKSDVFKPTPHMKVWLDTAIDLQLSSPTDISIKSGIDRTTWYKWLETPGFEDWYYAQYKTKRRRWLPVLDEIGMKNSKRDYNYWKDMREAVDGDTKHQKLTMSVEFTERGGEPM